MKTHGSGYSAKRAAPHEDAIWRVNEELCYRGFPVTWMDGPDGHRPDGRMGIDHVEVKTGGPNIAVEAASLATYEFIERTELGFVYIIWLPLAQHTHLGDWRVYRPSDLRANIIGDTDRPRPPTGNGSNDWWWLIHPNHPNPGSPFDDMFQVATG